MGVCTDFGQQLRMQSLRQSVVVAEGAAAVRCHAMDSQTCCVFLLPLARVESSRLFPLILSFRITDAYSLRAILCDFLNLLCLEHASLVNPVSATPVLKSVKHRGAVFDSTGNHASACACNCRSVTHTSLRNTVRLVFLSSVSLVPITSYATLLAPPIS